MLLVWPRCTRVPIPLDFPQASKRGGLAIPGPAARTSSRSWTCIGRGAGRPRGTTSSSWRPWSSTSSQTRSAASVSHRRAPALRGCGTCLSSSSTRSTTTRPRVSRSMRTCKCTCNSALRAHAHATTSLLVVAHRTSYARVASPRLVAHRRSRMRSTASSTCSSTPSSSSCTCDHVVVLRAHVAAIVVVRRTNDVHAHVSSSSPRDEARVRGRRKWTSLQRRKVEKRQADPTNEGKGAGCNSLHVEVVPVDRVGDCCLFSWDGMTTRKR
mmetsp:Transcript_3730/g.23442  ORF Transcript_3730/g.23442 Transcript_3730/m.23442 type:complete len:269 (+) Transcript_3730:3135-3941(+)